ncbi:MAG: GNAT family N-acetyltransferase [Anaerolineales bacterium]|nr:GNAT family N-acetyltransferase [Chloroflexota bacterium]MBL6980799.1 GNAT family N-acetyltransferase [Anaerolineales bacterium]
MTTKTNIFIPEAPQIPGLRFRYFRGESDYPVIMNVFNACKVVDDFDYTMTLDGVAHHFETITNCDPFTDMIFVEIDDEPIAYGRVGWYKESEGNYIYYSLGWIIPEWRRKGIGTAILKHNERRIYEIAADHPSEAPKLFQNEHNEKQVAVAALLKINGYEGIRWGYELVRPIDAHLPEAPMPEGLQVRPVTEDHYRLIWDAQSEAFIDHWGHTETTEEDYQRWLSDPVTFGPEIWKVAWDGDQVAGMVLNFVSEKENEEYQRKRGYTEFISVRRPWRRLGLARSLLVQSIEMFREMGMEDTLLGVDTQNPNHALNLYEGVGYKITRKSTTYRKPL